MPCFSNTVWNRDVPGIYPSLGVTESLNLRAKLIPAPLACELLTGKGSLSFISVFTKESPDLTDSWHLVNTSGVSGSEVSPGEPMTPLQSF